MDKFFTVKSNLDPTISPEFMSIFKFMLKGMPYWQRSWIHRVLIKKEPPSLSVEAASPVDQAEWRSAPAASRAEERTHWGVRLRPMWDGRREHFILILGVVSLQALLGQSGQSPQIPCSYRMKAVSFNYLHVHRCRSKLAKICCPNCWQDSITSRKKTCQKIYYLRGQKRKQE